VTAGALTYFFGAARNVVRQPSQQKKYALSSTRAEIALVGSTVI
jgi:hypothetical protein